MPHHFQSTNLLHMSLELLDLDFVEKTNAYECYMDLTTSFNGNHFHFINDQSIQ